MLYNFVSEFLRKVHSVNWFIMFTGAVFALISFMDTEHSDFLWAFGVGLFVGTFTYFATVALFSVLFMYMRNRAQKITQRRVPDFVIGDPEQPYMLCWWWLPRNRFFNVYIHKMLKDDDDRALHDHPWPSLSHMVDGTIIEHYLVQVAGVGAYTETRTLSKGDWIWRPTSFAHRLAVPSQDDLPMTIFITGPRIRKWGFHCPKGWRHWMDFVSSEDKGQIGRGCGEMEGKPKGEY
jgi:hypothetical protein